MKFSACYFPIVLCAIGIAGAFLPLSAQDSAVSIIDRGNYYEVVLDYSTGVSHYEMGQKLCQQALLAVPDFELLIDSYMAEFATIQLIYTTLLSRVADIKPQIPQDYQDEIDGMASQLSGGSVNTIGDGKLSKDELYIVQLFPDIARMTQCSGVSVYGARSASGTTMTARILDWNDGADHQLAQIQSVTTIKNGSKSVCLIGYLGLAGVLTGFNDDGIFAGILDSPSGASYSSTGKHSYVLDLRYALENNTALTDVAGYLTDPSREYTYNHLILLSDKQTSKVIENNISGTGTNIRRALRDEASSLTEGITWGFTNAMATVNSFLLSGNFDNHTGKSVNTQRWASIKTQLQLCGDTVSLNELKQIASFDNGDGPHAQSQGDIYNIGTQQIVLFQPDIFHLETAFKPKSGILPTDPVFEVIPVSFGMTSIAAADNYAPHQGSMVLTGHSSITRNSLTQISFKLTIASFVTLHIFDMLGRKVATIAPGQLSAGYHTLRWNAGGKPNGCYFYRLQAGCSGEVMNR